LSQRSLLHETFLERLQDYYHIGWRLRRREEYVFYDALGKLPKVPRDKFFSDALGKSYKVPRDKQESAIGQFRFRPDTEVSVKKKAEILIYGATIFAWIVIGTLAVIFLIFPEAMPTQ
jgi:hypothetical protein